MDFLDRFEACIMSGAIGDAWGAVMKMNPKPMIQRFII